MFVFQQGAQKQAPSNTTEQQAAIEKFNSAFELQKTLQSNPQNLTKAIQLYEDALKDKNLPKDYAVAAQNNLISLLIPRAQLNQMSDSSMCKNDVLRIFELDATKSTLLTPFAYNMVLAVPDLINSNPKEAQKVLNDASELIQKAPESQTKQEVSCMILLHKAKIKEKEAYNGDATAQTASLKELSKLISDIEAIPNYTEILSKRQELESFRGVKSTASILSAKLSASN